MKKILLGLSMLVLAGCGGPNSNSTETIGSGFEWDFSKKQKFIYVFSQTVHGENKMDRDRPAEKSFLTGIGHLNVRVKEDTLADLSLTDIEIKRVNYDLEGSPLDSIDQEVPVTVLQDMKPDGSYGDTRSDLLFDMLLPLPDRDLKEGESDEIPMQMPFNANGSSLFVKGQNTMTFKGYEEIDGRNCAVLEGVTDISMLDIPEELKGEYKCAVTGTGTYYFDLEQGHYVGADIQISMYIMMDVQTDDTDGFGHFMEMQSDNVYKVRLKSIEE